MDLVWNESVRAPRPQYPQGVARVHPIEYAGVSHEQKLRALQEKMSSKGAHVAVLGALDEVCTARICHRDYSFSASTT